MDEFLYVRTLRGAIYGKVALVQHRTTGALYAVKMMSLAHMSARQAVAGASVCEDGDAELRILRRLSGNRVFYNGSGSSVSGLPTASDGRLVGENSWSMSPEWESRHQSCSSPRVEDAYSSNLRDLQDPRQHSNILMLHKDFVDEHSNARCLVLDYCPYGELYDQVGAQHPGNSSSKTVALAGGADAARGFFQQIARAVRFIHAHNIAHRDISLENVLVDEHLQCRLADFGLASEHGATCVGRVGKTFYMAPEVLASQPEELYDGLKSDIWSLGVLLFILVAGAPPFETPAESDARFRVVKHQGVGQLLCIWQMENRVTDELRDLLALMLTVNPLERIAIDKVCSHPWLLASVSDEEEYEAQRTSESNNSMEKATPQSRQHDSQEGADCDGCAKSSLALELEPQEYDEMGNEPTADGALGATTMSHQRVRKRMKISIVSDSAMMGSNRNGFSFALASSSAALTAASSDTNAFDGQSVSFAPALAHENSPWGHDTTGSLFAPHTTPTAGPRARSGGRRVTLRSLCFHSGDGLSNNGNGYDFSDAEGDNGDGEEDKFAFARRRRTSLSFSCVATTKPLGAESSRIEERPPQCRYCLDDLVQEDTPSSSKNDAQCVCESCFHAMPSLGTTRDSEDAADSSSRMAEASVMVLRKVSRCRAAAQVA